VCIRVCVCVWCVYVCVCAVCVSVSVCLCMVSVCVCYLKTLQEKGCVVTINDKPMKFGAISIEDFLQKMINFEKNKIQKLQEILIVIKNLTLSNSFVTIPKNNFKPQS